MKRIRYIITILALTLALQAQAQSIVERKGIENPDKWIAASFAKGKLPPFSFTLDGVPSEKFIKGWEYSKNKLAAPQPGAVSYDIVYRDRKSGLKVTATVTGYSDSGAAEWVLRFENAGSGNSGRIGNVRSADFILKEKGATGYAMRRCKGSDAEVDDFSIIEEPLGEGQSVELETIRGRSSDYVSMPFFNITAVGADCGAVFSIGWTGDWKASFQGEKGQCRIEAGLKNADFYLKKGESVRTPMSSVMFWKGKGEMAGHNAFRRFVIAHHSRKVDGKPWTPLLGGFDWGDPAPCNEYTCLTEDLARAIVRRYRQFDIMPDVFWLDAGWYTTPEGNHFDGNFGWYNVGNWECDSERFPDGFVNMSNLMHSFGSEFMVWFEPERVMKGTNFAENHPEFMLSNPQEDRYYAFNMADAKAVDWLCKYIGDFMEINGIDHYRQDFNTGALAEFWAAADEKGRRGITEMKYIEGLYKYWDYLLKRFPRLQIDNCASGGRRLDLETVSRATPLWRTDYNYGEPLGYQCQTYGINMFLPLSCTGLYQTDFYNSRSGYGSSTVMNFALLDGSQDAREMKRVYDEYKSIQKYFTKDYYPLSGLGNVSAGNIWVAYQMHDPATGSGFVVGFRRPDCPRDSYTVNLQALSPNGTYIVTNCNTGVEREMYGGDMMNGFVLSSEEAPDSVLIKYVKE